MRSNEPILCQMLSYFRQFESIYAIKKQNAKTVREVLGKAHRRDDGVNILSGRRGVDPYKLLWSVFACENTRDSIIPSVAIKKICVRISNTRTQPKI